MKIVYAKHEPYVNGHLGQVGADMELAGPPTIRVIKRSDGAYFALEGSHRLAQAHYRKIEPKLVIEIPELDESLDSFWERIAPNLPRYDFGTVHVLDLKKFVLST